MKERPANILAKEPFGKLIGEIRYAAEEGKTYALRVTDAKTGQSTSRELSFDEGVAFYAVDTNQRKQSEVRMELVETDAEGKELSIDVGTVTTKDPGLLALQLGEKEFLKNGKIAAQNLGFTQEQQDKLWEWMQEIGSVAYAKQLAQDQKRASKIADLLKPKVSVEPEVR